MAFLQGHEGIAKSQNHAAEDDGDDPDDIERSDKPKKRGVQSSQSSEPAPRKGKGRLLGHAKKGKTVRTKEDDWLDDDFPLLEDKHARPTDALSRKLVIPNLTLKKDTVRRASSKRFILDDQQTEDIRCKPWSEQYSPATTDELAVHKKKVADVREWLSGALSGRSSRRSVSSKSCLVGVSLISQ